MTKTRYAQCNCGLEDQGQDSENQIWKLLHTPYGGVSPPHLFKYCYIMLLNKHSI